ncbi:MAG: hypothetical protein ACKOZX_00935, partial [Gammaproteobacteria bacterium]
RLLELGGARPAQVSANQMSADEARADGVRADRGNTGPLAHWVPGLDAIGPARARQLARQGMLNGELSGPALRAVCALPSGSAGLFARATERFNLSARSTHRVLRTARTIADLAGTEGIEEPHLMEALGFRGLEWERGLGQGSGA